MLHRRGLLTGAGITAAVAMSRRSRADMPIEVLFQQPSYPEGVGPNFSVRDVVPAYTPTGKFYLHANQPNPYRTDNDFVPVLWDAGMMTGFHAPPDRRRYQKGIWVPAQATGRGHTVAQIHGSVVGAYLHSRDLIHGSPGNRMMIAPSYHFPGKPVPFAKKDSGLKLSVDLQVPTATDAHINGLSNTYIKLDLLFVCNKTHGRLSLSCGLFANGGSLKGDGIGFDDLTNTTIIAAQVSTASDLLNLHSDSALFQGAPWSGWKSFSFSITRDQFASGLAAASPIAATYGDALSRDPEDYVLSTTHLNAELHYTPSKPATLGWSMRHLSVAQRG